jgi:hypothetical protein
MTDNTSDMKIPGDQSKRFRVVHKGGSVASYDTEEELNAGRQHDEDLMAARAGRGCDPADLRYEIFDGNELLYTRSAREID